MRTKKEKIIRARVNDELFNQINNLASSAGETTSDTIRQILKSGHAVSLDELRSLRREINSIGCNVNQLARSANQSGHRTDIYEQFSGFVSDFRTAIEKFRRACNAE